MKLTMAEAPGNIVLLRPRWGYRCARCDHEWVPDELRGASDTQRPAKPKTSPKVCPKCKSPYWDRPRQR
jgi:DNA-directed RNA polymerase subunit RPC12/RpoP